MKKLIALLMSAILLVSLLTACGTTEDKSKDTATTTVSTTTTTATTTADTTTTTGEGSTTTEGAASTDGTTTADGSTTGSTAIDTTAVTNPTSTNKTTKPTTAPDQGEENAIRFGLTVEEIQEMRRTGSYHPDEYYRADANIRQVINQLSGALLPGDTNQFQDIVSSLLQWGDEFFVLGDFEMYRQAQERVQEIYRDKAAFRRMQLTNIAKSGFFSSDRSIAEYARDIWKLPGF